MVEWLHSSEVENGLLRICVAGIFYICLLLSNNYRSLASERKDEIGMELYERKAPSLFESVVQFGTDAKRCSPAKLLAASLKTLEGLLFEA